MDDNLGFDTLAVRAGIRLCSITGNLGDMRTTITHLSTTTQGRLTSELREAAGIREGLIRLAVVSKILRLYAPIWRAVWVRRRAAT
jgi:O-acetylhomoserine/O-acetylserine sulfhydrylase-like pyridoxal-dependent enzyme